MNNKLAILGIIITGLLVFSAFFVLLPNPSTTNQAAYASASAAGNYSNQQTNYSTGSSTGTSSSAIDDLPSQVGGC